MTSDMRPLRKEDVKIRHPIMGAHANIECVDRERVLCAVAWVEEELSRLGGLDSLGRNSGMKILREAFGVLDDKKEEQEK